MKPLSSRKPQQRTLKPTLEVGSAVYSAFWPATDPDRSSEPDWYPGIVASYRVPSRSSEECDPRYGPGRRYDVHFDDGDEIEDVPDHLIMDAEEYLLQSRGDDSDDDDSDDDDSDDGGTEHRWTGVRNVTDRTSSDTWARHVGWYVAEIDGAERTFSLLSDALRAYDSSVVRRRGTEVKAEELNLPEEWKKLFAEVEAAEGKMEDARRAEERGRVAVKNATREALKEGAARAQTRHKAEMERLQRKADDAKEAAEREAVQKERGLHSIMLTQLKKEMKAKRSVELENLRERHREEVEQLEKDMQDQRESLEKEFEERRDRGEHLKLKPRFEVGDEVCAAWWPDSNEKEIASWYFGHVKSYSELEACNSEASRREGEGGGEFSTYGPTRIYRIKYNDDGSELSVPEHLIFHRADYELSMSYPPPHKWKGVKNVMDLKSSDKWAKFVGWYVATVDGEELAFSRLSEALRARDSSVVSRRGEKVKKIELNLPEDWEWLFSKGGMVTPNLYDEEGLKKELQKEREKVKSRLEKTHAKETYIAVSEAVKEALRIKEKELQMEKEKEKEKILRKLDKVYEKEKQAAVREAVKSAVEKERNNLNKAQKQQQPEIALERAIEVAVTKEKELKNFYEDETARAVQEAIRLAQVEYDVLHNLQEEKWEQVLHAERQDSGIRVEQLEQELRRQFRHEKEREMYWLRVEVHLQQSELELLKARLLERKPPGEDNDSPELLEEEDRGNRKKRGRDSQDPLPPQRRAKRAEVGPDWGQTSMSQPTPGRLCPGDSDQAAGQTTTEDRYAHERAIAALLVAAERMEKEEKEEKEIKVPSHIIRLQQRQRDPTGDLNHTQVFKKQRNYNMVTACS